MDRRAPEVCRQVAETAAGPRSCQAPVAHGAADGAQPLPVLRRTPATVLARWRDGLGQRRREGGVPTGGAPLRRWVLAPGDAPPVALAGDAPLLGQRGAVLGVRVGDRGAAAPACPCGSSARNLPVKAGPLSIS